jgi:dihydrofolate synthase/folylpolyglutamate synthase
MRFNSVSQWLTWQESLNPKEIELGLDRVREVAGRLDLLHTNPKVISVAGTNGKGSCTAMLSAILTQAGYRTGAYTSPHLLRYNERIRINDADIDDETLCRAFQCVDDARDEIPLTYFEFGTLAALQIFAEASLDVVILEVGLGGRLDAVNVLDADVSLISTVDIDHVDWLGNDREQIASEKAGIARAQQPMIYGDSNPPKVIETTAEALQSPLYLLGRDFNYSADVEAWDWTGCQTQYQGLTMPALTGEQQLRNAATCLAVLERLHEFLPITSEHIQKGLQQVRLPGRFQLIKDNLTGKNIVQVIDVAHNPQSALILAQNLKRHTTQGSKTIAVYSALNDKDIEQVIRSVKDEIHEWFIAPLPVARTASISQLESAFRATGIQAWHAFDSVAAAYNAAQESVVEHDRIVVFGSFHTAAIVLSQLEQSSV